MLVDMLVTVTRYVGAFFVSMLLLRFFLQWFRIPFRNQLGQFVMATTNWAVMPARRVVPSLSGLDVASLICAWILQAALVAVIDALVGRDLLSAPANAAATILSRAAVDLIQYALQMLFFVLILQVILSWVSPGNTIQYSLDQLTRPMLRPIRRIVPPIANVDLSPAILILVLILIFPLLDRLRVLVDGYF